MEAKQTQKCVKIHHTQNSSAPNTPQHATNLQYVCKYNQIYSVVLVVLCVSHQQDAKSVYGWYRIFEFLSWHDMRTRTGQHDISSVRKFQQNCYVDPAKILAPFCSISNWNHWSDRPNKSNITSNLLQSSSIQYHIIGWREDVHLFDPPIFWRPKDLVPYRISVQSIHSVFFFFTQGRIPCWYLTSFLVDSWWLMISWKKLNTI